MRIIHRIAAHKSADELQAWSHAQMPLKPGTESEVIYVNDEDKRWPAISEIVSEFKLSHSVDTEFSTKELSAAKYLDVGAWRRSGYPQPESGLGRPEPTYDRNSYCGECGVGAKQVTPFLMLGEPKWGSQMILQLNWVPDEYFVKPEVYHELLEPIGIGFKPVLKYRDRSVLKTVVQIDVPVAVNVDVDNFVFEICSQCGSKKYKFLSSGFCTRPHALNDELICRSKQWFGAGGHAAYNRVMIAQQVYQAFIDAKIKGTDFKACEY